MWEWSSIPLGSELGGGVEVGDGPRRETYLHGGSRTNDYSGLKTPNTED